MVKRLGSFINQKCMENEREPAERVPGTDTKRKKEGERMKTDWFGKRM